MTEESSVFLTGPAVVRDALGEDVTAAELGGTRVHERNGVCRFVASDEVDAIHLSRELLGYLPSHRDRPAVGIIRRRELAAADDPDEARERLAANYAEAQLRAQVAASTGYVDELIAPAHTRARLSWAFRSLEGAS